MVTKPKSGASGYPLSFAAIIVESMTESRRFYEDVIGFDLVAEGRGGPELAQLLALPRSTVIHMAMMSACGSAVGNILLLEIDAPSRQRIREPGDRTTRGLWNLNFYVDDIWAVYADLRTAGYEFWSEPVSYQISEVAGRAIEVLFEAPDGVAINLVQPLGDDGVFTGRIRKEAFALGRTAKGFTPVATTAHCVHDIEAAKSFYRAILHSEIVIDEILGKPETNRFLARPDHARTHTVFLAGNHTFGKLSLNHPLNYDVPERVSRATAPNIGYIAQGFVVGNLESARTAASMSGSDVRSSARVALPGRGQHDCFVAAIPGSGALAWVVGPN